MESPGRPLAAAPEQVTAMTKRSKSGDSQSTPRTMKQTISKEDLAMAQMESARRRASASAMTFEGAKGNISALKVKALAIRLRHKVAQARLKDESNASYASLEGKAAVPTGKSSDFTALMHILNHPFSILILALPVGVVSHFRGWGGIPTFWLNILALIPLAKILGDGTEELAAAIKNDTISGLLNATLGNAVEMILSVQTLRKGLLDVVKATLLGSILSNILLVLGTSFLLGGLVGSPTVAGRHHIIHSDDYVPSTCTLEKEQVFSSKSALVNMAMQLLACMTCALPTVFAAASSADGIEQDKEKVVEVSRVGAIIIMASYVAYILFQLVTHKKMLAVDEGEDSEDDEEEEVEVGMSAKSALVLMFFTTLLIAIGSEMLVGAIEEVVGHGIPARFIGIILLPFAGNACEHASAVRFAMQDRPGLSIGIAVGSSTQIALFVVPFSVVMGWALGQPMDLVFGSMNTAVMILSVLVVLTLVIDGRSNWLKGFMLCVAYVFCAVLYWFMPPPLE